MRHGAHAHGAVPCVRVWWRGTRDGIPHRPARQASRLAWLSCLLSCRDASSITPTPPALPHAALHCALQPPPPRCAAGPLPHHFRAAHAVSSYLRQKGMALRGAKTWHLCHCPFGIYSIPCPCHGTHHSPPAHAPPHAHTHHLPYLPFYIRHLLPLTPLPPTLPPISCTTHTQAATHALPPRREACTTYPSG